jgi:predicted nucleic-acid-binding Zn-ribbon protein
MEEVDNFGKSENVEKVERSISTTGGNFNLMMFATKNKYVVV